MYPRAFDYIAPTTLEQASADVADRPGAKVLAGGMSLIPMMKLRVLSPPTIVDIGRVAGLGSIAEGDDRVEIGALVRHYQLAGNQLLVHRAAALAEAAGWVGDPQVRNRGTLCGSLAHADTSADEPAALLALGGTMVAHSTRGTRTIPAAEFFVDAFTTALTEDEILTGASIPLSGPGEGSAYCKVGRRGGHDGFAVAGVAAWVKLEHGDITDARVSLTGVSTRPLLADGIRAELIGSDGRAEVVRTASARAEEGVVFIADLYGSEDYKAHLARYLAVQALEGALHRAREDSRP
ncbi:MAG: FAD binding domain-containing protein [Acidimicrobiia bacterium]